MLSPDIEESEKVKSIELETSDEPILKAKSPSRMASLDTFLEKQIFDTSSYNDHTPDDNEPDSTSSSSKENDDTSSSKSKYNQIKQHVISEKVEKDSFSIVFQEKSITTASEQIYSSGMKEESSNTSKVFLQLAQNVSSTKRRRFKSLGPLFEKTPMDLERPKALDLAISSNSDPGGLKNVGRSRFSTNKEHGNTKDDDGAKCQSVVSPNPRTYMYIQMELCKKESLKDWLFANVTRDCNQIYSFFNDIISAVEYVHDLALIHRDLKVNFFIYFEHI